MDAANNKNDSGMSLRLALRLSSRGSWVRIPSSAPAITIDVASRTSAAQLEVLCKLRIAYSAASTQGEGARMKFNATLGHD